MKSDEDRLVGATSTMARIYIYGPSSSPFKHSHKVRPPRERTERNTREDIPQQRRGGRPAERTQYQLTTCQDILQQQAPQSMITEMKR